MKKKKNLERENERAKLRLSGVVYVLITRKIMDILGFLRYFILP